MEKRELKIRLVDENTVICPKCSRKNVKKIEKCIECGFPLQDKTLIKIIPMEFLQRR